MGLALYALLAKCRDDRGVAQSHYTGTSYKGSSLNTASLGLPEDDNSALDEAEEVESVIMEAIQTMEEEQEEIMDNLERLDDEARSQRAMSSVRGSRSLRSGATGSRRSLGTSKYSIHV